MPTAHKSIAAAADVTVNARQAQEALLSAGALQRAIFNSRNVSNIASETKPLESAEFAAATKTVGPLWLLQNEPAPVHGRSS
jgi:hypothetical protein